MISSGRLMIVGVVGSIAAAGASGQSLPYTPPDFNDPNCMLDDPWVWEDFGGPIPCAGRNRHETTEVQPQNTTLSASAIRSATILREDIQQVALVTWSEMQLTDRLQGIPSALPPAPQLMDSGSTETTVESSSQQAQALYSPMQATGPTVGMNFRGAVRADTKLTRPPDGLYPPDTMGAIGPLHFVQAINGFVGVFDKASGLRLSEVTLRAFFYAIGGDLPTFDPRILFDQDSRRWFVLAAKSPGTPGPHLVAVAVSRTEDPVDGWFQFGLPAAEVPDYPTLGVDLRGIYIAADFADQVWALDKGPLVSDPPSLGAIASWYVVLEGALQPAHTYGFPGAEYLVQVDSLSGLRIFKITMPVPAFCPTLTDIGVVPVTTFSRSQRAPALGTDPSHPINTLDGRLLMSVYRAGSLWTCHAINAGAGAACRWYEIDPENLTLLQSGTVADETLYYYFPSFMVNAHGDVAMGFSGSNANQYIAAYVTGRKAGDPSGEMALPALLKAGEASYTLLDGATPPRNRWGDYSYTTLDPDDELTFWTIQEYAASSNGAPDEWGTWIGELSFAGFDCNSNGTADPDDIAGGTSADCNTNGRPDECERDCNSNGISDACEIAAGTASDCNSNGIPDACDMESGTGPSRDCDRTGTPDECEFRDCNLNCNPDEHDISSGSSADCNLNGVPDECEQRDCNDDGIPDDCELAAGSSPDCDANGLPDDCDPDCDEDGLPDSCDLVEGEPDCNFNCYPDSCDIASLWSSDCDNNGVPDECQPDCNVNGVADTCDISAGTSGDCNLDGIPDECSDDCNSNGTPDVCEDDCNSNGIEDDCDLADQVSVDSVGSNGIGPPNGVPDECDLELPIARAISAATRKTHANCGAQDIAINLTGRVENGNVTTEPRYRAIGDATGGVRELRIAFDSVPGGPGSNPVAIWQQTGCPPGSQSNYDEYSGSQSVTATIAGNELVLIFTPGLENARTYKLRVNTSVTRVASQAFELRCLLADVNMNGQVNSADRSVVIGVWTGSGYSKETDINLSGGTNNTDRAIVIGAWTGANCSP